MELNVLEELVKLRASLMAAVNNNPLPVSIKLMIVEEMVLALRPIATAEIKQILEKMNEVGGT